jgi:DNA helicase-2/ATP-dependent DNA helicase PcrA
VLRRQARRIGLEPNFTILDRGDAEDVVGLLRSRAGLDRKDRRFPRKGAILEILSMAVNRAMSVPEVVESSYGHLYDHLDDLVALGEAYTKYKREKNLVDYDDLLVHLRNLLRDEPEIAAQLSRTYRYIMVDEYQDTNPIQADIVRGLATAHQNVWRSATTARASTRSAGRPSATSWTSHAVRGHAAHQARGELPLDAAHPRSRQRHHRPCLGEAHKVLRTQRGAGEQPLILQCTDEQAQSRFVCQRILELREEGVPLDEIAVLFRSSFHSFDLELELQRADLPFVKRGGFKFIETAHVKDVLAHLRVLANPRDAVSWHRVLLLLDGLGPRTADDLTAQLATVSGLEEATERLTAYPRRGAYTKDLARLAALLRELSPEELSPGEKVARVVGFYVPCCATHTPRTFRSARRTSSTSSRSPRATAAWRRS